MLTARGLDPMAEAVYQLMAGRPEGWGVPQLAARLGCEETEVREALDRLAEIALLRRSVERPGTWRAVIPEVGLHVLLQRHQQELDHRQREIDAHHTTVARMIAELSDRSALRSGADVEQLIGADAVQAHLDLVANRADSTVHTLMPGGTQSQSAIDAARPNDALALRRGVELRTLCLDSIRRHHTTLAYAHWLTESGAAVRTMATLPLRMILVDGTHAIVPLDPADSRAGAVIVRAAGALTALNALFELLWNSGVDLCAAPSAEEPPELTHQESALLALLSEGLTDGAAGRQLGVSLSTVRRSMAALMERLGARSRFEAGVLAARRGWL